MKLLKKLLSVLMILSMLVAMFGIGGVNVSAAGETKLRFNSDGKFKIVVFADCQDGASPNSKMVELIEDALDSEQPDLVAFTGDNVVVTLESQFKTGAKKIIQPLIDRGIPYFYTFGNHDDQFGMKKEDMHDIYMTLGNCLTYDADPSTDGFGNCNLPIYSSTGDDIAFNLWVIDSLTYEVGVTEYDHVHENQLEWYKRTSIALEEQAGHKVNSIMFQHIAMPEIYNLLVEDSSGSKSYMGKKYRQELNSNATGYLGEFPCPPKTNGGQFDALLERGDVLGVVSGHDHSNGFHGTYKGIGFLQMPGMSFKSYGDDNCRGYGVIEIDENDTSTYSTHTVSYINYWNGAAAVNTWDSSGFYGAPLDGKYISELKFAAGTTASNVKKEITNAGFTLIDKDLNEEAGGRFIYMGYKTTNDMSKSIRDIRFYIAGADEARSSVTSVVNGVNCSFTKVSDVDLNKGVSGRYIYAYASYDANAGLPITEITLTDTSSERSCRVLSNPNKPADLNSGAGGEYIFCDVERITALDVEPLFEKVELACQILGNNVFYSNSDKTLRTAISNAQAVIDDLNNDGITDKSQHEIDLLVSEIEQGISLLTFEVKFVNYDGTLIETAYVTYGAEAVCHSTPVKPSDAEHNYTFVGWDKDIDAVYSSMTVTACYLADHYHSSSGPATCTEDEVCQFCGLVLSEATGHGDTELRNVKAATCDKDGYTGDYCCTVCADVITSGENIPATGHVWGDWVYYVMPTMTKTGSERSTCSVCKTSIYRDCEASSATVEDEFIYGFTSNLAPENVGDYFNQTYLSVTQTPYNGKVMGTNSTISVTQRNVTTVYTVVVFGDVNGDGWYDGQDSVLVSCLANGMLTKADVTEAEYIASDCNHDGVIDENDVALLNEAGSLLAGVDQTKTNEELQTSSVYNEYIRMIDQSPELEIEDVQEEAPADGSETQDSIFEIILNYIKSFIELILSFIPSYLK